MTTILRFDQLPEKIQFFAKWHLIQLVERIIFKKNLSKMDLPFKFCKIGLKNTLFIFGRKNGRSLFVVVVVCLLQFFVRFWLTFFKIEAFVELRKMLSRKKLYHARFGNCSTPKVPIFCRFTKFTKMQLTLLLDERSVLDKLFFQNEVQRVLYKLGLVTYPLDHFCRIYSPSNFRFSQKKIKFVPITIIMLPKINLEHLELLRPWGPQIQLHGGPRFT